MINKNEINSFNNNKSIVPQYNVTKEKYNPEEKILLTEVRENLVDIAMSSDENLQVNERKLLNDIQDFLFLRLSQNPTNTKLGTDYIKTLSNKFLREIVGYGKIDSLIKDDELEEIMIIGVNKPIYVYHRKYGMMKTNLIYDNEQEQENLKKTH